MSQGALSSRVLSDVLWRPSGLARAVALVLAGTAALAIAAKTQVPFWPVPMTMQSLVVLLIGISYGSRLGAITLLAYLAEGLVGLPVFAGPTAGPSYLTGPTGGYLVGFVLAAGLTGWLAERGWDKSIGSAAAALIFGHILLFVPGVLWLAVLFGWSRAVAVGVAPFLAATVFKTALGVALLAAAWSAIGRRRA